MSVRRNRRRRQIQGRNGSVTPAAKRKDSPCPQDEHSRSDKKLRYTGPSLPEDIWWYIHSLMRLRDAASAACVSHSFLRSWRRYPNLTITRETLGLKVSEFAMSLKISRYLARKTDHILKNHSGNGVKVLKVEMHDFPLFSTSSDLDRWLHIAVKPGIEELYLWLDLHSRDAAVYDFPCPLLLNGSGKSITHLDLSSCAFRPTPGLLGCLRSLTSLNFCRVRVTGDELGYLLSSSVALETMTVVGCHELISLQIPSLQRLSHLIVNECNNLQVIESKAPNLNRFTYAGDPVRLSLGDSLRDFRISASGSGWDFVHYACGNLPRMLPNLEALDIIARYARETPVIPHKFLQLQQLYIGYFSPDYDYLSLVSLLDACPSLETFVLHVDPCRVEQESVLVDSSRDLRQMPGHLHRNIKYVWITGFCSARTIFELTCHILENAMSLEWLTLSTLYSGAFTCSNGKFSECLEMSKDMIMEAHKTLLAIERYIVVKVPSSVELQVVEPCGRCNPLEN